MTGWTSEELTKIGNADELQLASTPRRYAAQTGHHVGGTSL
jgi:hypothetical protein